MAAIFDILVIAAVCSFYTVSLITTPIYLESIYNDKNIFCKIIAPPAIQPVDKRWPDVEVVIKVGC